MITAVIIDDEQKNVSMLSRMLHEYCPQVSLLDSADSAETGKPIIERLQPQLVFLDIEMPFGNGFDLLKSLPKTLPEIIFVTAFDQYALEAFRYSALDYLLKPVNIEQLVDAVCRAEQRIKEKNFAHNYLHLLHNLDEKDVLKKTIPFIDKGQQYFIPLAEIKYLIADGSYVHIHTEKRSFVSTKNLKDFEIMLPAHFFCRIHHGHIVNKLHMVRVEKGRGGYVLMKDGKTLEVSVRRKEGFLKMLRL